MSSKKTQKEMSATRYVRKKYKKSVGHKICPWSKQGMSSTRYGRKKNEKSNVRHKICPQKTQEEMSATRFCTHILWRTFVFADISCGGHFCTCRAQLALTSYCYFYPIGGSFFPGPLYAFLRECTALDESTRDPAIYVRINDELRRVKYKKVRIRAT